MTRTLPFALLFALPTAAAPLPDHERDRLAVARTFGTWTDPTGEYSFRADGPGLRVKLPAAAHRVGLPVPLSRQQPRFVRRVEGDFTAVVRVRCPALPDGAVADGRLVAAGLLATDAAGTMAAVWRNELVDAAGRLPFGTHWQSDRAGGGMRWGKAEPDGRAWLRLTRRGTSLVIGSGWDGKEVGDGAPQEVNWVGPVDVGVYVESTSRVPTEVTFDRFTLTQPPPRKEAAP